MQNISTSLLRKEEHIFNFRHLLLQISFQVVLTIGSHSHKNYYYYYYIIIPTLPMFIIEPVARSSTAVQVQWEWLLSPLSEEKMYGPSQSGARLVSVIRISEAKDVRFSEVSNVLALR